RITGKQYWRDPRINRKLFFYFKYFVFLYGEKEIYIRMKTPDNSKNPGFKKSVKPTKKSQTPQSKKDRPSFSEDDDDFDFDGFEDFDDFDDLEDEDDY